MNKRILIKLSLPKKKIKAIPLASLLVVLGFVLLAVSVAVSLDNWRVNITLNQRVARLVYEANHGVKNGVPSTLKPSTAASANYKVAPSLPRYLIIPKLGVNAQILSVGLDSQGALETPDNVFETAWYNASVEPGQLGAMLIDGHISSWTTNGVFYGLDTLVPGDIIAVQSGDGAVFTYKVVKTQVYYANDVDMSAAMKSINPKEPGLNLISCTGTVIPNTSEFTERIIVFAEFASGPATQ